MFLRILLRVLGVLMAIASRTSERFRAQLSRDLAVEICTDDGVAHHYEFRNRRVRSRPGVAKNPACSLRFATSRQGVSCLIRRAGPQRLMSGLLDGSISVDGNIQLLLWFQGLPHAIVPITPVPHLPSTPPGAYVAPDPSSTVAGRIIREPSVTELDPSWEAAVRQRQKIVLIRAADRQPHLPF
jgi:hypothetical protein